VQTPENLQNYNRYSYVLNNPLSQIDPSGHFIIGLIVGVALAVVGLVGAVIATVALFIAYLVALAAQFVIMVVGAVGQAFGAMGTALLSAAKAGIAYAVKAITLKSILIGAGLGAVFNGAQAAIAGGSFSDILKAAAIGAVSGAVGAVTGSFLHGFGSALGSIASGGTSIPGTIVHMAAHGAVGGGMSAAQGGSFKDGFIGSVIGVGVTAVGSSLSGGLPLYNPNNPNYSSAAFVVGRTAIAAITGGLASMAAGGKFADGAFSAAFFHLFNAEYEIAFGGKKYVGYTSDSIELDTHEGFSYQMEKNGKYLGYCHAEAQFFTGAPDSGNTAGGPTLAELIDAGVSMDGLAFSTFSKSDGSRINNGKEGFDHTVMVVTKLETVTKPQTFLQKLFRARAVTTTSLKVEFWENYRTPQKPTGIGLSSRIIQDYRTEKGGSGNMPYRLIIKK
jgi:hypothetical protein